MFNRRHLTYLSVCSLEIIETYSQRHLKATLVTSTAGTRVVPQVALVIVVKRQIIGVAHSSTWLVSDNAELRIGAMSSAFGVTATHVASVPEPKLLITSQLITSRIGIISVNGITCPAPSLSRRSLPFATLKLGVILDTFYFPNLRR